MKIYSKINKNVLHNGLTDFPVRTVQVRIYKGFTFTPTKRGDFK